MPASPLVEVDWLLVLDPGPYVIGLHVAVEDHPHQVCIPAPPSIHVGIATDTTETDVTRPRIIGIHGRRAVVSPARGCPAILCRGGRNQFEHGHTIIRLGHACCQVGWRDSERGARRRSAL